MAKAKTTPVKEQLITLTKEQHTKLLEVRALLDAATDTLDNIDGDENAFAIGRMVGDAHSDLIRAYNELSDVIIDNQDDDDDESDDDDKDEWTFA
jgi:hypothetical protein